MESAYELSMHRVLKNFEINYLRVGTVAKFEINLAYKWTFYLKYKLDLTNFYQRSIFLETTLKK